MDTDNDPCEDRGFKKSTTPKNIDLSNYGNFVYSVSVGANRPIKDVAGAYRWAKEKKDYPIDSILVGDGPYKITLAIVKGLKGTEAEYKAIEAGNELIDSFTKIACIEGVRLLKTNELIATTAFRCAYSQIEALYLSDDTFQRSIIKDAFSYVDRQESVGALMISEAEARIIDPLFEAGNSHIFASCRARLAGRLLSRQGDSDLGQNHDWGNPGRYPEALKRRVNVGLQKKKSRTNAALSKAPQAVLSCARGSIRAPRNLPQSLPDRALPASAVWSAALLHCSPGQSRVGWRGGKQQSGGSCAAARFHLRIGGANPKR